MDPTTQQINELRNKFFQRIEEEHKDVHPKDLNRIKTDDFWLKRFLLHHDLVIKDALDMLVDTCNWRNTNGINDISENTVNLDYLREGSLFVHNKDKDGQPLLIFKSKKHVKGQKDFEELKRVVIYWFEKLERMDNGDQMTIFFDMADTGLANMDMEYTKYLINLCKHYYPYFLNYILIFEMPWVLNAAFRVIKGWLPAKAVQKIKFVNKSNLKEYVDVDQCLISWGGTDPYEFSLDLEIDASKLEDSKKKVHFADVGWNSNDSPRDSGVGLSPAHSTPANPDPNGAAGSKLKILPADAISFSNDGNEMSGRLTISNTSDSTLAYKVKTTSPDRYRVKPSQGLLDQGASVVINLVLQAGYAENTVLRDKFLVMSFSLDSSECSASDLNELWKNVDPKRVEQQRVRCTIACYNGSPGTGFNSPGSVASGDVAAKSELGTLILAINQLHAKVDTIENNVWHTKLIAFVNMLLIILLAGFFFTFDKTDCFTTPSFLKN